MNNVIPITSKRKQKPLNEMFRLREVFDFDISLENLMTFDGISHKLASDIITRINAAILAKKLEVYKTHQEG